MNDIKGSRCMITSIILANTLFILSPSATFFLICCIRFCLRFSTPGVLWIFLLSLLGIISFALSIPYAIKCFSYFTFKTCRSKLYSSLHTLFCILQFVLLLLGTTKMGFWYGEHAYSYCLVLMILEWVFFPLYIVVVITCEAVFKVRVKHFESEKILDTMADPSRVPTCCCQSEIGQEDCCHCCELCCTGYEVDPNRKRFNNSVCCDGCCNCCLDCCIECCGEANRPLPPGVTGNDIVYINSNHRVVYMPDNQNVPMTPLLVNSDIPVAIPASQMQPMEYKPVVFYSDMNNQQANPPVYLIPSNIPNQTTFYQNTAAPVVMVRDSN